MKKLVTDSFYSTETTSSIPGTSSDGSFTVSTAPSGTFGWLIVNFSDSTKREVIEFYDRSGTTIYYRGVNRKSPKTHDPQSPVIISNPSNLFSYFEKITQNTFYYEKKSALVITVWGGIVRTGGSQYTIEDTDITLTDNSINYVYFDTTDQTIKITTTQETAEAQFPLHTIVTLTGAITTETAYNIIDIVPRENASGFIGLDSLSTPANDDILVIYDASDSVYKKITRSDFLQSITEIETFKVKVSAGDTTGGYLEDKLVAGTGITLTKGNAGGDETYTVETSAQTIAEHAYYTPAYLTGGTSIQTTYSTWLVVTDASFRIPVDGVDYNVYVDFTGITNLAGVATKIEEAIQAAVGSAVTCTLETDHFVITSADTTSASDIGFLTTATSTVGTDISGSGWMDCASGSATQTAKVLDPTHDAGRTPVLGDDGLLPVEFMPTNVQEADAFFAATDIAGAEAETLSNGSNADSLHVHSYPVAVLSGTRTSAEGSGNEVIAHGLSRTPKAIMVTASMSGGTGQSALSIGFSDGSTNRVNGKSNPSYSAGYDSEAIGNYAINVKAYPSSGVYTQWTATATFDATNITLEFTKTGTGTASCNYSILVIS